MIDGLKETLDFWEADGRVYYVVIEKWKRIPVFEGFICDAYGFDLPGYKVADEILVGDGILRITLIED